MEKQLTARNMSRATFIAGTTLAAAAGLGLMTSSAKADDSSKAAEAEAPVAPEAPSSYTPGTYIGTATGNSGRVVVETVLGDSMAIEGVRILSHSETDHLMYAVEQILPARIVEAQSLDVDGVTGATITSFAVKSAVEDCIAQAGGDVAQLNEAPAPEAAPESLSCQVFIVGTGAAGLVAAVELQHAGADVLLVEQQDFAGGCTRFSYGRMFAALDEEGIDNIRNEFLKQTTVGQRPYDEAEFPNMDKVDQYVTEGYEAMVFMRDVMGLPLEYYGWVEGNERSTYDVSCTKVHLGANDFEAYSGSKGFQLVETLLATYENLGGRVMFGTKVTGLVQGEDGAVTGAEAVTAGGPISIAADYVLIATGSVGNNQEMQAIYAPERADGEARTISMGSDGSGIQMMIDLRAKVLPDWINSAARYSHNPSVARTDAGEKFGPTFSNTIANGNALLLDETCTRRGDESNAFVPLMYYRPGVVDAVYAILDAKNVENQGFIEQLENGLVTYPEAFFRANSIEALAEACGLDPDALCAAVDAYNGYCASGVDEEWGKAAEKLIPVESGPFYAVHETLVNRDIAVLTAEAAKASTVETNAADPAIAAFDLEPIEGPYYAIRLYISAINTQGGPKRAADGNIVKPGGVGIPRLYGAGEMGTIYSYNYNGGGNVGEALSSGRLAARSIGALQPWE